MEKIAKRKPGFVAGRNVNFNSTGAVIIEEENGSSLHKFCLQQDGSYREEWRGHLWNVNCRKHLTDAGNVILQQGQPATTFLFDPDMEVIDSWNYQGELIACLPGQRVVYAVQENESIFRVDIRNMDGEVLQLESKGGTWITGGLSVCEDAGTGKLVVTKDSLHFNGSLDIFSPDGKTRQRVRHEIFI